MNAEFENLLEAEWEGSLDDAGRRRMETLCAADAALAARLHEERQMSRLLASVGPSRAPRDLAAGVFARLDSEEALEGEEAAGGVGAIDGKSASAISVQSRPQPQPEEQTGFWRRWFMPSLRLGGGLAVAAVVLFEISTLIQQNKNPGAGETAAIPRKLAVAQKTPLIADGMQLASADKKKAESASPARPDQNSAENAHAEAQKTNSKDQGRAASAAGERDALAGPAPAIETAKPAPAVELAMAPAPVPSPAETPPPAAALAAAASSGATPEVKLPDAIRPLESPVVASAPADSSPNQFRSSLRDQSTDTAKSATPSVPATDRRVAMLIALPPYAPTPPAGRGGGGRGGRVGGAPGAVQGFAGGNRAPSLDQYGSALQGNGGANSQRASVSRATTHRDVEIAAATAGGNILETKPVAGRPGYWQLACSLTPAQMSVFLDSLDRLGLTRTEIPAAASGVIAPPPVQSQGRAASPAAGAPAAPAGNLSRFEQLKAAGIDVEVQGGSNQPSANSATLGTPSVSPAIPFGSLAPGRYAVTQGAAWAGKDAAAAGPAPLVVTIEIQER